MCLIPEVSSAVAPSLLAAAAAAAETIRAGEGRSRAAVEVRAKKRHSRREQRGERRGAEKIGKVRWEEIKEASGGKNSCSAARRGVY